jgi:hypothetical protein
LVYFPDIKTIPLRIIFGSMERFQNVEWKDDVALRDDLSNYVLQNYRRREILDFMKRDYYQYAWSLGTLSRRLNYFEIKYVNWKCGKCVENAVCEELEGPGQLLGYRLLHKKNLKDHGLAVPRGLLYDVMTNVDPEGIERRGGVGRAKRRRGPTGTFTSLVCRLHSTFWCGVRILLIVNNYEQQNKLGNILMFCSLGTKPHPLRWWPRQTYGLHEGHIPTCLIWNARCF